ncbi:MAG: Glu-tRNA(Gln) amidotransferase subunit GatD [Candidatus Bathyarchaeia archaeon]
MSESLSGYRGKVKQILEKANVRVGQLIRLARDSEVYEGTLMPRTELGDSDHIVIKLRNGYNAGIRAGPELAIEFLEEGVRPSFTTPQPPPSSEKLPQVTIVSTGGTIASRVEYRTGAVRPALSAEDLHSVVPELSNIARVRAEILLSLLSENITPKHWTEISKAVARRIEAGDAGVVVAHGTDTMAYTAAALSFALEDLPCPVVMVGSQRSSDRPSSDAPLNLTAAVHAAANSQFAGVIVAMHENTSDDAVALHRGTKVRKCHTSSRDAFESINVPLVGRVAGGMIDVLDSSFGKRVKNKKVKLNPNFDERVLLLQTYPGLSPKILDWAIENQYRGIVLAGTGLGHANQDLFNGIGKAVQHGLLLTMTSQCLWGSTSMNVYDTGRDLLHLGVLPAGDMLPEVALVKMMWLLAQDLSKDEIKTLMQKNIAGELYERRLIT